MNRIKNVLLGSGMVTLLLALSGCVGTDSNGNPDTSGIIYRFLVRPMGSLMQYLANDFGWGFGWAVIFITIIVRIIIMPLGINQSRKSLIQSEKMQAIKPQMDAINAKVKAATSQEEQMEANREMQELYKANNMSMFGGIGCLPLLIQMPIFSALYFAARYTEGISGSVFFGINLGDVSYVLAAIAGLSYLAQSFISMIGLPEEQKKTMRSMMIVSPLMIGFMSISAPAGVTLYWVVGGVFSCIQSFITNVMMRPKIKAQIQEELKKNPPKQVVTPRKDVTPTPAEPIQNRNAGGSDKNGRGRNAGKQQRK
ncbi:membrane protein insertase YidC [Enterococcus sp. LJL120]